MKFLPALNRYKRVGDRGSVRQSSMYCTYTPTRHWTICNKYLQHCKAIIINVEILNILVRFGTMYCRLMPYSVRSAYLICPMVCGVSFVASLNDSLTYSTYGAKNELIASCLRRPDPFLSAFGYDGYIEMTVRAQDFVCSVGINEIKLKGVQSQRFRQSSDQPSLPLPWGIAHLLELMSDSDSN